MSELIKATTSKTVIAMGRLRPMTFFVITITFILILSSAPFSEAVNPTIWAWGIEGEPELGQGFDVWANVTDADFDLANVTVEVVGPNMSINNLLTFNGTFYVGSVPSFPNDGEFSVRIKAFDLAGGSRTSARIYIDFESNPVIPVDPLLTMPIVVSSSLGLMVVVVGLACIYDRKKSLGEGVIAQE